MKPKRLAVFLLVTFLFTLSLPAEAEGVKQRLSKDGVLKITGTGAVDKLEYEGREREIWSLEIGEGITEIGDGVFRNLRLLDEVSFPESLESIGDFAFENCVFLDTLQFPASLTHLGAGAFRGCENLQDVQFAGDAPECSICWQPFESSAHLYAEEEAEGFVRPFFAGGVLDSEESFWELLFPEEDEEALRERLEALRPPFDWFVDEGETLETVLLSWYGHDDPELRDFVIQYNGGRIREDGGLWTGVGIWLPPEP